MVQETIREFGYNPLDLRSKSSKSIIFQCEFCLKSFRSTLKAFHRNEKFCCPACTLVAKYHSGLSIDKHEFFLQFINNQQYINRESTVEKFGYDPLTIGLKSNKLVIVQCEFCLQEYETKLITLNNRRGAACKNCDSIAAAYSHSHSQENKHIFYQNRRINYQTDCLDIEATIKQFGYSPLEISSFSRKKVVTKCKFCSQSLLIPMSKFSLRKGDITCWSCMGKKTKETLKRKYGVECTLEIPEVKLKLSNPQTEQIIEAILKNRYKVDYDRNHIIGPYSFDFFLPSINLLIECQGDFFHNFKDYGYSGLPKDRAKSSYIENNTSYKLIWIWEHELHIGRLNKILDYHIYKISEPTLEINLKDLNFKSISNQEAHVFLSQYHYLGNLGTIAVSYGCFYQDLLVSVVVFGGITRNQSIGKVNKYLKTNFGPKEIRELRRFCIRPNMIVKNMATFCLKKFIDLYLKSNSNVKSIISFSDESVGDIGTIYKASNWIQLPNTNKSYHYLDPITNRQIHKKTVWDLARNNHCSEEQFVNNSNLVKVEEMPKKVWIKQL